MFRPLWNISLSEKGMWETIRGYLTFTRKERFGVLFLLIIISILFILPYFFRPAVGDPDPAAYEKMKAEIRNFESKDMDSSRAAVIRNRYHDYKPDTRDIQSPLRAESFYFDPNSINAGDWQRLGLTERLSKTILHYTEKGGRFLKPTDLKKIYGLLPADYERIFPFVRIKKIHENFKPGSGYYAAPGQDISNVKYADSFFRRTFRINSVTGYTSNKKLQPTDINLADSADWSVLPGIGAKLAARIIHFREKLGGFYNINQVGETFGLPDSCFQKIKSCLHLNTFFLQQIDLNAATIEALQAHPYIRWQIAKWIIQYRQQHGNFHSVDELLQLAGMDSAKFEKIKPYLIAKY